MTQKTDDNTSKSVTLTDSKNDYETNSANAKAVKHSESEFISDAFKTNEKDLEEVQEGMKKLGIDTLAKQVTDGTGTSSNGKI